MKIQDFPGEHAYGPREPGEFSGLRRLTRPLYLGHLPTAVNRMQVSVNTNTANEYKFNNPRNAKFND